jgi:hypothetical protein
MNKYSEKQINTGKNEKMQEKTNIYREKTNIYRKNN